MYYYDKQKKSHSGSIMLGVIIVAIIAVTYMAYKSTRQPINWHTNETLCSGMLGCNK